MNPNAQGEQMSGTAFAAAFLASLASREKDVLKGRFGLDGSEPMTLQAIGDRYGITRERVRQIEAGALTELRKTSGSHPYVRRMTEAASKELRAMGGVALETTLIEKLKRVMNDKSAEQAFGNVVRFVLEFSNKFEFNRDSGGNWHSYWYLTDADKKKAESFVASLASKAEGNMFKDVLTAQAKLAKISGPVAENYVSISKSFVQGPFGEMGLAAAAEINPKTARDWAYAVLKREGKPIHFSDLAKMIGDRRSGKKTNTQTIHNELIKDNRFVLVGRGLYGLKEHGYISGTAREIISHLLSKHGALHPGEVVRLVREQRMLKDATILINLQNRKHFTCLPDGKYCVKEA